MEIKNTPLFEVHTTLGAKMVPFAGYNMPLQYSTLTEEHHAVRQSVGIFDVSHMGEFIVKGREALALVQKVTSNDASKLLPGQAQYSCLPNKNGGIVDDLLVYRLGSDMCSEGEQAFMLVVNASNIEKDLSWINQHNTFDTRVINISDQTGLLAIQGPNAIQVLQKLTNVDLASIPYYSFVKGSIAGFDNIIISATGYTGSGGFELYTAASNTVEIWQKIMEAGDEYNIKPCGLGARDTLRLEKGYCLYGNDINDSTSPLEAGLGWITKLKKEGDFVGKSVIESVKANGLKKKLVGFTLNERRVPRHDYNIFDSNDQIIGIVTSGTHAPSLDKPIGMGYVETEFSSPGSSIYIEFGKKKLLATVCTLPFLS